MKALCRYGARRVKEKEPLLPKGVLLHDPKTHPLCRNLAAVISPRARCSCAPTDDALYQENLARSKRFIGLLLIVII